jgi:hypothetical protein
MNFAPLYGAIAATAAIRRTSEEQRKYEEGFASRRHQAIERFEQLEDEAGQSVDELRTEQQDIEARMNEIFPPPPPELVCEWTQGTTGGTVSDLCTKAAQWGADQELEACCEWLNGGSKIDYDTAALLRAARRPKPPSLKEQALEELENMVKAAKDFGFGGTDPTAIRQVLEALPND